MCCVLDCKIIHVFATTQRDGPYIYIYIYIYKANCYFCFVGFLKPGSEGRTYIEKCL